ncbi:LysR family transcriptional regulator [Sphaerisporangium sp. B11E5]|uniref:LysR family transcriptional regulator n=1 Tax=Sphaerisporangium sp. B11E5 TaxID=3153563 RepID=UPI00325E558C
MLDTWSLQVLAAVGEHGSFSAAAEALSLTQPAVSRQIAGLERRLGVCLFSRVPRGVRVTPAGEIAVEMARDTLARLRALEARLASFADLESGVLRLAAFPSANAFLVPEAIRRFADAHPGVSLSLLRADPAAPLRAVREGLIDLELITHWHLYEDGEAARYASPGESPRRIALDGVELVPLLDEELRIALPADHRLARVHRVHLADLADETWIDGAHPDCLGPMTPLTEALGTAPRVGLWCDDWNGKQALVAARAGVMLVPSLAHTALRDDVVVLPVTPSLPTRRLYAVAAPAHCRAPAVTAMLAILADLTARHRLSRRVPRQLVPGA